MSVCSVMIYVKSNVSEKGFDSEADLLDDWNTNGNKDLWGAVVFTSDVTSNPPSTLDYKLRVSLRRGEEDQDRWRTANTYEFFATFGKRNNDSTGGEPCMYTFQSVFLE